MEASPVHASDATALTFLDVLQLQLLEDYNKQDDSQIR